MKRKIKPDPFGSDAEFDAYIRASQRKALACIVAVVILGALLFIL